ncbi:SRPBCC family protein [Streptomyces sp. RB6PN25]|uniref:SRPBCC family protein n=1 Tax=Streptomyces humicola TaxID=2953240 RepID=A0ABT1PPH9_9ACTN|nr:SRPBCC family protein [Streptomyces humicola]MCQ4079573.1 SRPBCC family protein [Streptomyces humicola]
MELRHEFTVPVPVEEAWQALLDIERVAPCMPGATVDGVEGDDVSGSVKVKVGPVTLTYRGTATFTKKDADTHRLVLSARGKEIRGQGTAKATVTGMLREQDGGTAVAVVTDLSVTGRPAQFGRGVMAEVSDKLVGRFAACLAEQFTSRPEPEAQTHAEPRPEPEPLDLLRTAGPSVAKRVAAAGVLVALAVLAVVLARRRHRR